MSDTLVVHLNRGELHAIEPVTDRFEPAGAFDVTFRNHGRATHVHLKLEGPLAHVASMGDSNYFVGTDDAETVHVAVDEGKTIEGWLEVVTGYGERSARVGVNVRDEPEESPPVDVDASLAQPRPTDPSPGVAERLASDGGLQVLVLVVLALVLAGVAAAVTGDSPVVGFGVAVVLAGVATAGYILLSE